MTWPAGIQLLGATCADLATATSPPTVHLDAGCPTVEK